MDQQMATALVAGGSGVVGVLLGAALQGYLSSKAEQRRRAYEDGVDRRAQRARIYEEYLLALAGHIQAVAWAAVTCTEPDWYIESQADDLPEEPDKRWLRSHDKLRHLRVKISLVAPRSVLEAVDKMVAAHGAPGDHVDLHGVHYQMGHAQFLAWHEELLRVEELIQERMREDLRLAEDDT